MQAPRGDPTRAEPWALLNPTGWGRGAGSGHTEARQRLARVKGPRPSAAGDYFVGSTSGADVDDPAPQKLSDAGLFGIGITFVASCDDPKVTSNRSPPSLKP